MIQHLVKYEFVDEAYRGLQPRIKRVKRADDFHEWWTRDNQPRGSAQFRGSAGVLGKAIDMLHARGKAERSLMCDGIGVRS